MPPFCAETRGAFERDMAGLSVTMFRPFWVKKMKGQAEKVFLVPYR